MPGADLVVWSISESTLLTNNPPEVLPIKSVQLVDFSLIFETGTLTTPDPSTIASPALYHQTRAFELPFHLFYIAVFQLQPR